MVKYSKALIIALLAVNLFSSCCKERQLYCSSGTDVIKSSFPYQAKEKLIYQSESGKKIIVELGEIQASAGFNYETNCKLMSKQDRCEPGLTLIGTVTDSASIFPVYNRTFMLSIRNIENTGTREQYSLMAFGQHAEIWFGNNTVEDKTSGLDANFFVIENNYKTPYKTYSSVITYSAKQLTNKEKCMFDLNGKLIAFLSPGDSEWFYLVE